MRRHYSPVLGIAHINNINCGNRCYSTGYCEDYRIEVVLGYNFLTGPLLRTHLINLNQFSIYLLSEIRRGIIADHRLLPHKFEHAD